MHSSEQATLHASGSCSVAPIERAIIGFCSDILNLRALQGGDRTTMLRTVLDACTGALEGKRKAFDRLTEVMLATEGNVSHFAAKVRSAETEVATAEAAVEAAARALREAVPVDAAGADKRWRKVVAGVDSLDSDARITARQLVGDTFERIEVYHSGAGKPSKSGERVIELALQSKTGVRAFLRVKRDGTWVAQEKLQEAKPAKASKAKKARATA